VRQSRREEERRDAERRERSPLYIRFGDAPQTRRSFANIGKRRKRWEKGVSVFRGYQAEDGAYVVDVSKDFSQLGMYKLMVQERRPVYLASGRRIDTGSNHEPVLANIELTPLPEGTRVRCSGEGEAAVRLRYKLLVAGSSFGMFRPPAFMMEPAKEITTAAPKPVEPFAADPHTPGGRRALLAAVLAHSSAKETRTHGAEHWGRVALAGAAIADRTLPEVDLLAVFLFALLHDSMKLHDYADTWHGWRAANLARDLLSQNPAVSEEMLEKLCYAVEEHDAGETSEDPSVGACWDADRLCLWRVGIRPDPELLSTEAAVELIEWGRALQHERFTWEETMQAYEGSAAWKR
jgi:uncharacterized protein